MNLIKEIEIELHLEKLKLGLVTKRIDTDKKSTGRNVTTIFKFSFVHLHSVSS